MDKFMAVLHKYIGGFVTWWKNLTGLETKVYFNGKLPVNWGVISIPIIMMLGMVFFFKGGLLDYWGLLW